MSKNIVKVGSTLYSKGQGYEYKVTRSISTYDASVGREVELFVVEDPTSNSEVARFTEKMILEKYLLAI